MVTIERHHQAVTLIRAATAALVPSCDTRKVSATVGSLVRRAHYQIGRVMGMGHNDARRFARKVSTATAIEVAINVA